MDYTVFLAIIQADPQMMHRILTNYIQQNDDLKEQMHHLQDYAEMISAENDRRGSILYGDNDF